MPVHMNGVSVFAPDGGAFFAEIQREFACPA